MCRQTLHYQLSILLPQLEMDNYRTYMGPTSLMANQGYLMRSTTLFTAFTCFDFHLYLCSDDILRWFWSIVQKMTPLQRQQLLYFCTGSAVLPALSDRRDPDQGIIFLVHGVSMCEKNC